jgi:hypothetical protein
MIADRSAHLEIEWQLLDFPVCGVEYEHNSFVAQGVKSVSEFDQHIRIWCRATLSRSDD